MNIKSLLAMALMFEAMDTTGAAKEFRESELKSQDNKEENDGSN